MAAAPQDNKSKNPLANIIKWTFRSIMAMLTAGMCLLLIASAYSDVVNPNVWVLPSFLGIAFGILLILAVIWTGVLIVTRRRRCLVAMIVTWILIIAPALRLCPLHFADSQEPLTKASDGQKIERIDTLKIFSFNTNQMGQTHLSRIKEKIPVIDVIRQSGADICCLQEYGFCLTPGSHTQQEIRNRLKDIYPYYDYTPNDGRKALGIAIYSKYPITKGTRIDKRKKGYFSAMYYQLNVGGRTIGLVNMHMRSNMIKPDDRVLADEMIDHFEADSLQRIRTGMLHSLAQAYRLRGDEASMMRQFLLDTHPSDMPLIVSGDMNDTPISYCHRCLRQVGLTDTWQETGLGQGSTYRNHHFWFRIDNMLHSKHLRPLSMRIRKDVTLSDHYPIEATYQLLPE